MLLAAVLVAAAGSGRAEFVYYSPTRTDAVSIYVSTTQTDVNCRIYLTESRSEAQGQSAIWFVTLNRSEATLVVFRNPTRRDADRVVAFVWSRGEAKCPAP